MAIRISKVIRLLDKEASILVDFLHKKGFNEITADLNQKLTDEEFNILVAEYSQDETMRNEALTFLQNHENNEQISTEVSDGGNVHNTKNQEEHTTNKTRLKQPQKEDDIFRLKIDLVQVPKVVGKIDLQESKNKNDNKHWKNERICLCHRPDVWFIGKVKFYDSIKDFGFIQSNSCGMSKIWSRESYYFNSYSFNSVSTVRTGKFVIFQISMRPNGKQTAVNIREFTKSEEDYKLLLPYFGSFEMIESEDGHIINLFNYIKPPLDMMSAHVLQLIQKEEPRTTESTTSILCHFLDLYLSGKDILTDINFYSDQNAVNWKSFFSILTKEEAIVILRKYPDLSVYITNTDALREWVETIPNLDNDIKRLTAIQKIISYFPEDIAKEAKAKLEDKIDELIKLELKKLKNDSAVTDLDIRIRIEPYMNLSSKNYDAVINKFWESYRVKRFKDSLNRYKENPSNIYLLQALFNSYELLVGNKEKQLNEIKIVITTIIDDLMEKRRYYDSIPILKESQVLGEDFLSVYKTKLYPIFIQDLKQELDSNIDRWDIISNNFMHAYYKGVSLYNDKEKEKIKKSLYTSLIKTTSLGILNLFLERGLLSFESVIKRCEDILFSYQFKQIRNYVENYHLSLNDNSQFNDIIVQRTIQLIENHSLTESFDDTKHRGTVSEEDSQYIVDDNCDFLKQFISYVDKSNSTGKWQEYLKSRSYIDKKYLYEHGIVTELSDDVTKGLVDSISIDSVDAESNRWYYKPQLRDDIYKKILKDGSVDSFKLISDRLLSIKFTTDNIPLIVLLTELLGVNKPDKNDFYGIKEWEREFTPKIKSLKESLCRSDSRFGVILWAVFFLTTTSIEDLRQTFGYLPPYLQIRGVKKLFQLISQGKIKQNAKSLYEIINSGSQRVCLPLEIVFSYLIRREENPQAKLDNNLMLQLLDGREDHPEWIGIRQMISSCDGRWIVGENTGWQGELYNGLIEKRQDGRIKLFVPNHMIDELGEQCNYNNKYSKVIPEQIKISFSSSEYQCERVHDGTSYLFDKSCEMELYSIARRYDCKYDKMDHQITFTKDGNDEVFCECRASEVLDSNYSIPFYWCRNYPCFRPYLRFMLDTEWERYTVLDFMRILKIPIDIIKSDGKVLKYGHFIMLSGYLRGFANFYEHIKCRKCGGLLRPQNITNYASRAVNEYQCENEKCSEFEQVVYLNHCFNRQKCDTIIDSRDSKTCPNGQYICPKCGACCSTENFRRRISNLNSTGGVVSKWIMNFVDNELGHWERQERYCYKCGNKMQKDENNGSYYCSSCNVIEGSQIDNVIPHGSDIPF